MVTELNSAKRRSLISSLRAYSMNRSIYMQQGSLKMPAYSVTALSMYRKDDKNLLRKSDGHQSYSQMPQMPTTVSLDRFIDLRNIDRQVLIETFPDKKHKIKEAKSFLHWLFWITQSISDQVTVSESWHFTKKLKGRSSLHLHRWRSDLEEEYTKNYFPFVSSWSGQREQMASWHKVVLSRSKF